MFVTLNDAILRHAEAIYESAAFFGYESETARDTGATHGPWLTAWRHSAGPVIFATHLYERSEAIHLALGT